MRAPGFTVSHANGRRAAAALVEWARQRRDTLTPLAIALGVRLLVFSAASALLRLTLVRNNPALRSVSLIDAWDRMDATWYIRIARTGYDYSPVAGSRANFFPLYPALIALGGRLAAALGLPSPYTLVGMALAWAAFAGACLALYHLTLGRFDRRVATGAVTLLAVFPFSFYDGAVYTEAPYLLLAVGAFLALERGNWWWAAALAGLAGALRPPGLILGACVALAYALAWWRERRGWRWRGDALSLGLLPLGALAYTLYCWATFGDPLAYVRTSRAGWHEGLQINGLIFAWRLARSPHTWQIVHHPRAWMNLGYLQVTTDVAYLALALLCFVAVPFVWRLLGPVYAIFLGLSLLAPLLEFPTLNSQGRYLSVLFPVFILAAYLLRGRPRLLYLIAALSLVALCGYAAYFIGGFGLS